MKGVWFAIAVAAVMSGCSASTETEKNKAIAEKMFDAFNRHEWSAMAACYAEDALFLDPSYGKEYVSKNREETAVKYAEMEKMFPDIHDSITGVYPAGDKVTVEFVSTGSMSDSVKFSLPIISVLTIRDGLIVKDATYYDLENP